MSAESDSPHTWHDLYEEAVEIASTPSKSQKGPGGVGHSAQRTPERPPPSVREIVVNNDVSVFFMKSVPGVSVCGGKIGSSKKFCTMPLNGPGGAGCQYASHASKAVLVTPAYFIRAAKGHSAFCEPCLPVPDEGFSNPVDTALRGQRSSSEWTKMFPILATAATLPIDQQIDIIARGERNVTVGPTPAKRKIWAYDSDDDFIKTASETDDPNESQTFSQFFRDARLPEGQGVAARDKVLHIVRQWNDLLLSTEIYRTKIKDLDLATRVALEEIDDKVVQVTSMLGDKPEGDLPLTAWSAIAAVTEGSLDTKKEIDAKLEVLVDKVTELRQIMDGQMAPTVKLLTTAVKRLQLHPGAPNVPSVSERETALTLELEELAQAHRGLMRKQQESFHELTEVKESMANMKAMIEGRSSYHTVDQFDQMEYRRAMDDMRGQIYQIRRHVDNASSANTGAAAQGHSRESAAVLEDMASLRDSVANLNLEITSLKSELVSESISFGGHNFMTQDSYLLFITQHCPRGQLQFSVDFISLMECATNRNKNTVEQLKSMKTIAGAGFKDQGANHVTVYASFGTLIPALFGSEYNPSDPSKKMGDMKSMKEWDPMTERHGRKNTINTAVLALKRSMELQLASTFGQSSVAYFFFKNMLHATCTFWEALSAWITRYENEMVSQCNAESSPAQKNIHLEFDLLDAAFHVH